MSRSRNTTTISVATLALVLTLAGGAVSYSKHERDERTVLPEDATSTPTSQATTTPPASNPTPTGVSSPTATSTAAATPTPSPTQSTSTYKDGTYSAQGSYNTPAGTEVIGVTVTIKNDVVTAASGTNLATDRESREFQVDFIDTFPGRIIGKKISEVSFSRLAGSSLTTRGFNSAISSIKAKAS